MMPGSKKIGMLHLVNGLPMGGAEMAMLNYIMALGTEKYEHHVYCFGADGPMRERLEKKKINVHLSRRRKSIKHPIGFVVSTVRLIKELCGFILDNQIQFIQSHSSEANQLGVVVGRFLGTPMLPTVHSTMAFVDPRGLRDIRAILIRIANSVVYRLSDRVLVVSEEIKGIVRDLFGIADEKIVVLKNGITLDKVEGGAGEGHDVWPNHDGRIRVIAVGRLVESKGFDVLIKAVAELRKMGVENLRVRIVGEGEQRSSLQRLIQDLDLGESVQLAGLRDDVLSLMQRAHFFVMPSLYEGLSIAMIEAMACGLPIVASRAPGLKDHIDDGENGVLFKVGDHKDLSEKILSLINDEDKRLKMSRRARISFESEYNMKKNIRVLESALEEFTIK